MTEELGGCSKSTGEKQSFLRQLPHDVLTPPDSADKPPELATIIERQGRKCGDFEFGGDLIILFNIHGKHEELGACLLLKIFQLRRQRPAVATTGLPEFDEDRNLRRFHRVIEVPISDGRKILVHARHLFDANIGFRTAAASSAIFRYPAVVRWTPSFEYMAAS
jgi:hypothetical protein